MRGRVRGDREMEREGGSGLVRGRVRGEMERKGEGGRRVGRGVVRGKEGIVVYCYCVAPVIFLKVLGCV